MTRYTNTNGDVIYLMGTCDCGSSGGCEKCQDHMITSTPPIFYNPFLVKLVERGYQDLKEGKIKSWSQIKYD